MSDVTCKKLIEFLDDYLAQRLDRGAHESFESHLNGCPPCRDYLKTYADTTRLARPCCCPGKTPPLPDDLVKAILEAVQKGCRK